VLPVSTIIISSTKPFTELRQFSNSRPSFLVIMHNDKVGILNQPESDFIIFSTKALSNDFLYSFAKERK